MSSFHWNKKNKPNKKNEVCVKTSLSINGKLYLGVVIKKALKTS